MWNFVAALGLGAWIYLLIARGGFWRADQRLPRTPELPTQWPGVVAVVPARDEADVVGQAVASILNQDYPGSLRLVLVDDESRDGTARVARAAAPASDRPGDLTLVAGAPRPAGWSGKVWAMAQGVDQARTIDPAARYHWFTDADIGHDPATLRRLICHAEAHRLDLASLMVKLHCAGFWQRLLIPAFVFFFQKLYPFPWVNDPARAVAGAAGGSMLVRRQALDRIGGLQAIQGALIDDCSLARALKGGGGRLWLGLSETDRSLRPYDGLGGIWRMVKRTAFDQLGHSPLLLVGTLAGLALVYLAGPVALLAWPWHGDHNAAMFGALAWAAMAASYRPTLALYGLPALRGLTLPLAAFCYGLMTADSALAHWRGRGGHWKGRHRFPLNGTMR